MKQWKTRLSAIGAAVLMFGACFSSFAAASAAGDPDPDEITPAASSGNLCVTVPLYVCMYASNTSGAVYVPSADSYQITNYSDGEVVITSIQGISDELNLVDHEPQNLSDREIYMTVQGEQLTGARLPVNWNIGEGDPENGTAYGIQLSAAIASGNRNYLGESKACHIQYTFAYLPVDFTVTYVSEIDDGQGGKTAVGTPPDPIAAHKHKAEIVSDMSADGYIFQGWLNPNATRVVYETEENGDYKLDENGNKIIKTQMDEYGYVTQVTETYEETLRPGDIINPMSDMTLYAQWETDYASKFHASSNYLEDGGASYSVADPNGYIDVLLYNYEKTNEDLICGRTNADESLTADMTLQYKLTPSDNAKIQGVYNAATGTAVAGSGGVYAMGCDGSTKTVYRVRLVPASGSAWAENATVSLTATASDPDHTDTATRTFSGTFKILTAEKPEFTAVNNANGTVTVKIMTNDYNGDITVSWPSAKLTPDNTNDLMTNWVNSGSTTTQTIPGCVQDTVYTLTFFGSTSTTGGQDTTTIALN